MTPATMLRAAFVVAAGALLAACGGPAATETGARKTGAPAYQGAQNPFVAEGWKPGDEASWEQQMRNRAQAQNEYSRTGSGG